MIKTVWVCDGCDDSRTMSGPCDWKSIEISVSGFRDEKFELCPSCQIAFAEKINPKFWPRNAKEAA